MEKIKKIVSEYRNLIIVIILIVVGVYFTSYKEREGSDNMVSIPRPHFNNFSEELGASVINCQFKVLSNFSMKKDGKGESLIKYSIDNQDEAVNIIFSGLDTNTPVMKGNSGEDPLLVISNTDTEINLASSNSFGDVFFYKIYKNQKVATWYKSYDLLGNPYALLSMGYCY